MGAGYQKRDEEIVDYQLYLLEKTNLFLRGPKPLLRKGEYIACVGAAQTFGCFCEAPYPALLGRRFNLEVLNLGIAGAGPRFFLMNQAVLDSINNARFAIIQVMSARSEDNSLFDSGGLEYLTRRHDGKKIGAEPAYKELLANHNEEFVRRLIAETRRNWIESFGRFLQAIRIPKVIFWFSKRQPAYVEDYSDVQKLFGEFPQLVTDSMVKEIRKCDAAYVECVTSKGSPQQLVSRFTGKPAVVVGRADLGSRRQTHNSYYPSPGMHMDAGNSLEAVCAELLRRKDAVQ